jgi:hypothetical protein
MLKGRLPVEWCLLGVDADAVEAARRKYFDDMRMR